MVSMKQEDAVHRLGNGWLYLIGLAGCAEHHMQEVLRVGQAIIWVDKRLARKVLVALNILATP